MNSLEQRTWQPNKATTFWMLESWGSNATDSTAQKKRRVVHLEVIKIDKKLNLHWNVKSKIKNGGLVENAAKKLTDPSFILAHAAKLVPHSHHYGSGSRCTSPREGEITPDRTAHSWGLNLSTVIIILNYLAARLVYHSENKVLKTREWN